MSGDTVVGKFFDMQLIADKEIFMICKLIS